MWHDGSFQQFVLRDGTTLLQQGGGFHIRAVNQPKPFGWSDNADHIAVYAAETNPLLGAPSATDNWTLFADTSEYQAYYNDRYPYDMCSFRAHNGWRTDFKAAGNWAYHEARIAQGKTRVVVSYVVFIPGRSASIMSGLKNVFGSQPHPRLVPMIDMESGKGFAGPGDHSAEANDLAAQIGDWTGKPDLIGELAYANGGDYADNWPHIDSRLKRLVASYGSRDPGGYGQQYYGGLGTYPSPFGLPRSCPPFGAYVDMNVIRKSIDQIEMDFGIVTPAPLPSPSPIPLPASLEGQVFEIIRNSTTGAIRAIGPNFWRALEGDTPAETAHRVAIARGMPGCLNGGKVRDVSDDGMREAKLIYIGTL